MKRKKKTKQNIEYWKPRQVITQDNEDFEDKHEYQNEESEQDTDKKSKDINIQVSKINIGVGDLSIIVFCSELFIVLL